MYLLTTNVTRIKVHIGEVPSGTASSAVTTVETLFLLHAGTFTGFENYGNPPAIIARFRPSLMCGI
jgi:hypothetical protein